MDKKIIAAIKYTSRIIDLWLPLKIKYDNIPGLSVGIAYRGKLLYKAGFGYADLEKKIKMKPETCFRIASMSKMFTAVAIMQLAEKHLLSLDDPVKKYLPWFKVKNKNFNSKSIKIRQILSHSSGIWRDGDTPHWEKNSFPSKDQFIKSFSEKSLIFKNGKTFKYSNFGFAILGRVIEKIASLNYEKYVEENIIKKTGLNNTYPDFNTKIKNLATGYSGVIPNEKRKKFSHSQASAYAPAAGFISNVDNLIKFIFTFSRFQYRNKLIGKTSVRKMAKENKKTSRHGEFYGLGLQIFQIEKRKIVGHSGGYAGFNTQASLDTKNDISVIVLTNGNEHAAGSLCAGVYKTIYFFMDKVSKNEKLKNTEYFNKYLGVYRSRWEDTIIVPGSGSLIALNAKLNQPIESKTILKPIGENKFVIESDNKYDNIGEIAKFVFKKNKKTTLFWGPNSSERM